MELTSLLWHGFPTMPPTRPQVSRRFSTPAIACLFPGWTLSPGELLKGPETSTQPLVDATRTGKMPDSGCDVSDSDDCGCDYCQGYLAARALQTPDTERLDLAVLDADLRRVFQAWSKLPEAIRSSIAVLLDTESY